MLDALILAVGALICVAAFRALLTGGGEPQRDSLEPIQNPYAPD